MINWQAFGGIAQAVAAGTTLSLAIATFIMLRRDQARLKLDLMPTIHPNNTISLGMNMTNVGRRPITVVCWGTKRRIWQIKKKHDYLHFYRQPITLLENGKPEHVPSKDLLAHTLTAKILFIQDSTGKEWKVRRRKLKRLKKWIAQRTEEGKA